MMRYALILLLSYALVACMGNGSRPASDSGGVSDESSAMPGWVLNPPQQRDALFGVGSADVFSSLETAQSRAKEVAVSNLMQQIQVEVEAQSEAKIEQREDSKSGYQFAQSLHQEIRTRVPKMSFSFLEPVESYHDTQHKQIYVLVRLDVEKELQAAMKRAKELEQTAEKHAAQVMSTDSDAYQRIQQAAKVLLALESRRQLHFFALQLEPNSAGLPVPAKLDSLEREVLQALATLEVSISPLNGQGVDVTISQAMTEQLTKRGLRVSEKGRLQVKYRLKQINRYDNDTFFVTIEGMVELQDAKGKVVRSIKSSARGVSADEAAAVLRALNKLGAKVADEVVEVLFSGAK